MKLFPKFVLLLTLLSIIPAAIVGWRTTMINKEGMQVAILELHSQLAISISEQIDEYISSMSNEINYVSKTMGSQISWSDRQSILQSLLDTNENFVSVSIVDSNGKELLKAYNPLLERNPRLLSVAGDKSFINFKKNHMEPQFGRVYYKDGDPRINTAYPLTGNYCLYSVLSFSKLWSKVTGKKIASTGFAFIVDENGSIIAHPNKELAEKGVSAIKLPIVQQVLKSVTVGSSEYLDPDTRQEMVGAYAPVKAMKLGIIVQQAKQEAYISVDKMRKQSTILIVISILSAAFLAFFIARGLAQPLVKITDAAKKVAGKDFGVRVKVNTKDELRDLAETFNLMTTELQRYDKMHVDEIVAEKTKTEAVIFSIGDGILMTDNRGMLQLTNKNARAICSIPETGWLDRSVWDYLQNSSLKTSFEEIVNNPKQNFSKEIDLSVGELSRFFKLSSQEVLSPETKENLGIVTVMRNITLEKELDRMKDDFLHSITHDLRNPMTSIRGFLRFLIDGVAGPMNDQQKKMLDTMDRASNRLLSLINDILDIAKLESGRMTLTLSETDLPVLTKRMLEILESQATKKSIQLEVSSPENLPKMYADPDLLERVFTNLVGNSLKFTPENGKIIVKFEEAIEGSKDFIKVSVIDSGEGIPSEYLDKIFDKFQQVAGQKKGGTGLGLTICKHIVEAHLGRIWAESVIGRGSSFIFLLPKNLTSDALLINALKNQDFNIK